MRLRARNSTEIRRTGRETVLEVRRRIELFARALKRVPFVRQPKRAIEISLLLVCLQQAFGFEPFEVGQVAQRGEAKRLQEFPRGDIGEGGAGLRRADGAVDQALAFQRGDDVAADLPLSISVSKWDWRHVLRILRSQLGLDLGLSPN